MKVCKALYRRKKTSAYGALLKRMTEQMDDQSDDGRIQNHNADQTQRVHSRDFDAVGAHVLGNERHIGQTARRRGKQCGDDIHFRMPVDDPRGNKIEQRIADDGKQDDLPDMQHLDHLLTAHRIMGTGFHCKVLGYDPFVSAEEAAKRGFEKVDTVEELLERSDLVNVNVPLVKSTTNLVSREAMTHFKPGAVFVNAARGGVIDEDALYDAMVEGRLRAAACDTFVEEPVSPDNKLLTLRNFSATPHLGGNTEESLQKTGMQVVQDTIAVLNGNLSAAHRVN